MRRPIQALKERDYRIRHLALAWLLIHALAVAQAAAAPQFTEEQVAWLGQHETLRVGVMDSWPPISFVDETDQYNGISAGYLAALNARLDGRLRPVPGDWPTLQIALANGEIDAIMDFTPNPERRNRFAFTQQYVDIPHVIVAPRNTPFLRSEADLTGKTIALERGFGNVAYFRAHYPGVTIQLHADTSRALGAVAAGEADAYVGNRTVAIWLMNKEVMGNLRVHGRLAKEGSRLAIGVQRENRVLADVLDAALGDIGRIERQAIQAAWVRDWAGEGKMSFSPEDVDWLDRHSRIRVGFDPAYPPYSFRDDVEGGISGIAVDVTRKLAQDLGVELELVPFDSWADLLDAGKSGDIDVIPTMVERPERRTWFSFTRPYLVLSQYIIARDEDATRYKSKADLKGGKIALIKGYSMSDVMLSDFPDLQPTWFDSLEQALHAVSVGKADFTVADIGTAHHYIVREGLSNLSFAILYTRELSQQRFGVRNGLAPLAGLLDRALGTIDYQGMMDIHSRWTPTAVSRSQLSKRPALQFLSEKERAWLAAHPRIRLASDRNWMPFEGIDERGVHQGIAADYMKLVATRLGISFEASPAIPWSEVLRKVEDRELDVLACAMATPGRRRYAQFTKPYVSNPMVIVTLGSVGFVDGAEGLAGKAVAIEEGYASYDLIARRHPDVSLQTYPDSAAALQAVARGEVFAYIGNIANVSYVVRNLGLSNIKISGQLPYHFELAVGVRSDWPILASIIQKALDTISVEEKHAILQKWVDVSVAHPPDWALLLRVLAIVLVLAVVVIFWNLGLKRQVRLRTQQLEYQASYDNLTRLPNRRLALDRLGGMIGDAQRHHHCVALLFLDLDDFKRVNDHLGHEIGDFLLVEAAARLAHSIRDSDVIGRLGGDEFIVLVDQIRTPADATAVADSLLRSLERPFVLGSRELVLTASIGVSLYPDDGDDANELLRKADAAMYGAKHSGRNTFSFFTQAMNDELARRLVIEENMRGALERGEFSVRYQPQVAIAERSLIGFEALLRWHSPELGEISPAEFIPIAEHTGAIVPIGLFVFESAIAQVLEWQQKFDLSLVIAINLSPRQIRDPNLVASLREVLERHSPAPGSIELEITEGVLLKGQELVEDALRELKSLGLLIAMDDFGIGYSSLNYLRNYPFDTLKIDREFIRDMTQNPSDRELVHAAIAMSHALQLDVVAEGVETAGQLDMLNQLGCDVAQGYLFAAPLPAVEIPGWFEQFSAGQVTSST